MKQLRPLLAGGPYFQASQLLLSVSGGLDSMVLLDVFFRMQHVHKAPLSVLHVHHHTGTFADVAADLVQSRCQELKIACHRVDYHWDGRGNFEYQAAAFRRLHLEQNLKPGGYVVLAHHQADQLETFLQALTRGAGSSSPIGMSPERGRRLRPLLSIERRKISEHALLAGVPHLLDPSNGDTRRFRAAIRHRVTPVLDQFHPGFSSNLNGWIEDYNELQKGLTEVAEPLFRAHYHHGVLKRSVFQQTAPYLWDFILAFFWRESRIAKPDRDNRARLHSWLKNEEVGSFDHGGRHLWCDLDGLSFMPPTPGARLQGRLGVELCWGGWVFTLDRGPQKEQCPFPEGEPHFLIESGVPFPREMREQMRSLRIPHRIRALLPKFIIGGKEFQLPGILGAQSMGGLVLQHLQGPDPVSWLVGQTGG